MTGCALIVEKLNSELAGTVAWFSESQYPNLLTTVGQATGS